MTSLLLIVIIVSISNPFGFAKLLEHNILVKIYQRLFSIQIDSFLTTLLVTIEVIMQKKKLTLFDQVCHYKLKQTNKRLKFDT